MAHRFRLDVSPSDTTGDIVNYLVEQGLARMSNIQPGSVEAVVSNKRKFLNYLGKKNRETTDPGCNIKNFEYLGIVGRADPNNREGKIMNLRIKNFKEAKKRHKLL